MPNAISIVRLLLVPLGLWMTEEIRGARLAGETAPAVGLVVLLGILGISDLVDGWVARRYHATTHVGAILDAVADKVAQVAFVSYFTFRDVPGLTRLPLWFFAVVLLHDLLLATGYLVVRARRGFVVTEHRAHGKVSSLVLFFVILSIVLEAPYQLTIGGCMLSASLIVISTVGYLGEGSSK